jgi:S-DNA-T family DNA segregation ATPase FtsK/SpoIIIE
LFTGFGLASFLFVRLFFLTGLFMVVGISSKKLKGIWFWDLFALIIISILFGFFATSLPELGGTVGL